MSSVSAVDERVEFEKNRSVIWEMKYELLPALFINERERERARGKKSGENALKPKEDVDYERNEEF